MDNIKDYLTDLKEESAKNKKIMPCEGKINYHIIGNQYCLDNELVDRKNIGI